MIAACIAPVLGNALVDRKLKILQELLLKNLRSNDSKGLKTTLKSGLQLSVNNGSKSRWNSKR